MIHVHVHQWLFSIRVLVFNYIMNFKHCYKQASIGGDYDADDVACFFQISRHTM